MAGGRRLVKFEELPGHLQFNPYVTTGYRPPLDAKGCLDSLCYWHNESLNIYSHCKLNYCLIIELSLYINSYRSVIFYIISLSILVYLAYKWMDSSIDIYMYRLHYSMPAVWTQCHVPYIHVPF